MKPADYRYGPDLRSDSRLITGIDLNGAGHALRTDTDGRLEVAIAGGGGPGSGFDADTVDGLHAADLAASAHTHVWADITDPPATYAPSAHTHPWSEITSTPTTLAGYGIGADTLSVSSINNVSVTNHSHAITSSSNPGAAASILASAPTTGYLQLTGLGIGVAPSSKMIFVQGAGAGESSFSGTSVTDTDSPPQFGLQ